MNTGTPRRPWWGRLLVWTFRILILLAALLALRCLLVDLDVENGTQELVDQMAAIDRLKVHADAVLELAKFPRLPDGQPDPETTALTAVMQWAMEQRR